MRDKTYSNVAIVPMDQFMESANLYAFKGRYSDHFPMRIVTDFKAYDWDVSHLTLSRCINPSALAH